MHNKERGGEACSVLSPGTFEEEGAWYLVTSVEKVCKRCPQRKLARIEPYVAMQDVLFRADARLVPPPEISRVGASQIDERPDAVGPQEVPQKSRIGLRGTRCLALLDPVEIVGKVENQVAKTV
jgi:hypothetical protein